MNNSLIRSGVLLLTSASLFGCAAFDPSVEKNYQDSVEERDKSVVKAVADANADALKSWYKSISDISNKGGENSTAALIALAMSKPEPTKISVQKIERPERGSDYTKMVLGGLGIFGAVRAFDSLTDVAKNASGTVYNLTSGGDIKGSANTSKVENNVKAGGDSAISVENKPCQGNACKENESNQESSTPEIDERGGGACTTPEIYKDGIFWWNNTGCSCASHNAGHC